MKFHEVVKGYYSKYGFCSVAEYGVMCEDDARLVIKGYKESGQDREFGATIYTRKNSKYCYLLIER